jgi:hypothetical protein
MENLKEQLQDLYSQIYSICDEEGSDDVLFLLDAVCAQYEVEDIASRYFDEEQLTEDEAGRLLEVFEIVLDEIS